MHAVLDIDGLDLLIRTLAADGFEVLGPVVRDGAIRLAPIAGAADLPRGIGDEQEAGHYRLRQRDDGARFGYVVGPDSPKRRFHPPEAALWRARQHDGEIAVEAVVDDAAPVALIGVRACELAAIAVQDRVLRDGPFADPVYTGRRARSFLVAVDCGDPAATCFCASLGTGPAAREGFDLALSELLDGEPRYLVRTGSPAGEALLARLPSRPPTEADLEAAKRVEIGAVARMRRRLPAEGLPELLRECLEDPHFETVAQRCLACTNCTMVCPTCFCTRVEQRGDLAAEGFEASRSWDSCFTLDFSWIHGGSVRRSTASRYRQWFLHKLSTWVDQFGTLGCTGCGRCITWCPVGIDITAEAAALAARAREKTP